MRFWTSLSVLGSNPGAVVIMLREAWVASMVWVEIQVPDENSKMTRPYLVLASSQETPNGFEVTRVPWVPNAVDLFATDWLYRDESGVIVRTSSDYQERVIMERSELCNRIDKLSAFVGTTKFSELTDASKENLHEQLDLMIKLAGSLNKQIGSFS